MPTVASYVSSFLKPEMRHIYRQITGLDRYRTFVVCRERLEAASFPFEPVEIARPARSNFLRRFYLKYIRKEPPIVYRGEFRSLQQILDRHQPDLLHVYFGHTGVHLLPFLSHWPGPTVVSFHGMDIQPRGHDPSYEPRLRQLLQTCTLVLARSSSLLDRLRVLGCPEHKLRLNRTGIPLNAFPAIHRQVPEDGAWHLVQACRLIEKKGLDLTLRAFALVRQRFPLAHLTLAGDGPLETDLRQLADELDILPALTFAGFLDQGRLCQLYHSAHLFLHPSQTTSDLNQEGVPNSMLEAMATGLCVVATFHGGIPEAVEHSVAGLLSPERDLERFTQNILSLLDDPARLHNLGQAAALSVRRDFGQPSQVAHLESLYDEAIQLAPTRAHSPTNA